MIRAPDQTLEIYSTGKRWMWRFQHIDGQSEINELHVPLGQGDRHVEAAAGMSGRHSRALTSLAGVFGQWGKPSEASALHRELMDRAS